MTSRRWPASTTSPGRASPSSTRPVTGAWTRASASSLNCALPLVSSVMARSRNVGWTTATATFAEAAGAGGAGLPVAPASLGPRLHAASSARTGRSVTAPQRVIDHRGGPRDGPPDCSSEGGYAPLGLPRPTLGAPRETRGAPRFAPRLAAHLPARGAVGLLVLVGAAFARQLLQVRLHGQHRHRV